MANRIEVLTQVNDTKSSVMLKKLKSRGFELSGSKVIEVYTINKNLPPKDLVKVAQILSNPVSQDFYINQPAEFSDFDFALEIGFLPGVTDNIATTAKEAITDFTKKDFKNKESVHSSTLILLKGKISAADVEKIGESLANKLIQRIHIKNAAQYSADEGMDVIIPTVNLVAHPEADEVNLNISEPELLKLGKEGIPDEDGTRRGPLALGKEYLEAIKEYFEKEGRNPTDIELESIAQTWSEHCKHTIFASEIDELKEGLYKGYIKKATQEIRKQKGKKDFCVSVFSDNSGGIVFDDDWLITDKAETHNTPSALDPFGGAITGIVGVNRDCIGFGKGAKPIINKYGFCVGNIYDQRPLYRDKEQSNKMLPPRRILEGIIDGVNVGGNCSGIPTPQGFVYFDDSYRGKPLVFVGTIGLLPRTINGEPAHEKEAQSGDKIVVIGGRVGQDGIHGATFSSEALDSGSPATAVQIGDPITQKKLSDAIVKEARDQGLYNSITDNGAGGLSCSVAEMARECGGFIVDLEKIPLKYPNLPPWKIWTSESQERMTLSISESKLEEFTKLMESRGVEVSVIGEFTDSGRGVIKNEGEIIYDLDMNFLHEGLPAKKLNTSYKKEKYPNPKFEQPMDMTGTLLDMLDRPNICSYEFISTQYDHNVQAGSIVKPLQGAGRVNGRASVTKPFPESKKGVVCSQGINPTYSQIDTYHMAASAIDTAIRHTIAIGGNIEHLALMDNFCWCSSDDQERLGQLKAAVKACYDYAIAFGTPYISGKDSMYNDFKGFNADGDATKISILPTLLISSISVIDDVTKAVTLDTKFAGDLVYMIGETKNELGASEYFNYYEELEGEHGHHEALPSIGNDVPQVEAKTALKTYKQYCKAIDKRLISSAISPELGGLGVALAKKAIAGQLGMNIDLSKVPVSKDLKRDDYLLFSESQSRFIVTVDPAKQKDFEAAFKGSKIAHIGEVAEDNKFIVKGLNGDEIINTEVETLEEYYKQQFKDW